MSIQVYTQVIEKNVKLFGLGFFIALSLDYTLFLNLTPETSVVSICTISKLDNARRASLKASQQL